MLEVTVIFNGRKIAVVSDTFPTSVIERHSTGVKHVSALRRQRQVCTDRQTQINVHGISWKEYRSKVSQYFYNTTTLLIHMAEVTDWP